MLTSSNLYGTKKSIICCKNDLFVDTFSHDDGKEDENEELLCDMVAR